MNLLSTTRQLLGVVLLHSEHTMFPSPSPTALLSSKKVLFTLLPQAPWKTLVCLRGKVGSYSIWINSLAISKTLFELHFRHPTNKLTVSLRKWTSSYIFSHLQVLPLSCHFASVCKPRPISPLVGKYPSSCIFELRSFMSLSF